MIKSRHNVRRATTSDYNEIVSVGRKSVYDAHKGSVPDRILYQFIDASYTVEKIKEELSIPDNVYHVLEHENQVVGFSKILLNEAHKDIDRQDIVKLNRIYLLDDFHGLGLGKVLLNSIVEYAKNEEQAAIWLYTWVGNKRAIKFYERNGFVVAGSHDFHVAEDYYNPNHIMYLSLV